MTDRTTHQEIADLTLAVTVAEKGSSCPVCHSKFEDHPQDSRQVRHYHNCGVQLAKDRLEKLKDGARR